MSRKYNDILLERDMTGKPINADQLVKVLRQLLDFANLFLLLFAVRPIKAEVKRRHKEKGEASIAQIVFCVLDSAKLHLLFFTAVCVKEEAGR